MKNRAQASQNPSRFDLAASNGCQINGRSSQSQYLSDFGGAFWSQNVEKNHQILVKIQTAFQEHVCMLIFTDFQWFWNPKFLENHYFFQVCLKRLI